MVRERIAGPLLPDPAHDRLVDTHRAVSLFVGQRHFLLQLPPGIYRLCRSGLYYEPVPETAENLRLMRLIDKEYTAHLFLGIGRLAVWLSAHEQ